MTTAIALRDVSLSLGGERILDGANLALPVGATGVVMGETGCGKSSLLRLLLGLPGYQREDRAEIGGIVEVRAASIFDLGPGDLQAMRRSMGLIKGTGGLIENMDIRRNIGLALAYGTSGLRVDQVAARCQAVLEDLGIEHLAQPGLRPVALNLEERVYAELARTRVAEVDILLADDPTIGLGVGASQRFVDRLCEGAEQTRLIATTWLQPYLERADVFYLLADGRITLLGDADALAACDHPWVRAELAGGRRV